MKVYFYRFIFIFNELFHNGIVPKARLICMVFTLYIFLIIFELLLVFVLYLMSASLINDVP